MNDCPGGCYRLFEGGQEVHGAGRVTAKVLLNAAQQRRNGGWREEAHHPAELQLNSQDKQTEGEMEGKLSTNMALPCIIGCTEGMLSPSGLAIETPGPTLFAVVDPVPWACQCLGCLQTVFGT